MTKCILGQQLVQADNQPPLFLRGDGTDIAGKTWMNLLCCTTKIPIMLRSSCGECRRRRDLLFEKAVMLKWFLSVQGALDALAEGVQCALIFAASRVTQVTEDNSRW